jgi:hypothetical protein
VHALVRFRPNRTGDPEQVWRGFREDPGEPPRPGEGVLQHVEPVRGRFALIAVRNSSSQ